MGENNKGRTGIRWDNLVDKYIWKDLGGDLGRRGTVYIIENFWPVQDRSKRKNRRRGKASALRNKVKEEKHFEIYIRGVEGRYFWKENVPARPNGLREKVKTAISCRVDLDLPERRKTYQ